MEVRRRRKEKKKVVRKKDLCKKMLGGKRNFVFLAAINLLADTSSSTLCCFLISFSRSFFYRKLNSRFQFSGKAKVIRESLPNTKIHGNRVKGPHNKSFRSLSRKRLLRRHNCPRVGENERNGRQAVLINAHCMPRAAPQLG